MKKAKFILKKRLKDKHGVYLADTDPKTGIIRINTTAKAHKDKRELASTVKHELLHLRHPKMTEKEVYKKSAKTKIAPQEESKLLSKLRNKTRNYKVGALKRRYKLGRGDTKPGDFINLAKSQKTTIISTPKRVVKVEIMGLV